MAQGADSRFFALLSVSFSEDRSWGRHTLQIRPPCIGVKHPKIGKRWFRSRKNPHFPPPQKRASRVKKTHFYTPQGKLISFDSRRPFLGWREMGVFRLRNPLFPVLGFLTPVQGGRIRKPHLCSETRPAALAPRYAAFYPSMPAHRALQPAPFLFLQT